jgi:hypothetical protein
VGTGRKDQLHPHTLKTTQDLDQLIAQLATLGEQLAEGTAITLNMEKGFPTISVSPFSCRSVR